MKLDEFEKWLHQTGRNKSLIAELLNVGPSAIGNWGRDGRDIPAKGVMLIQQLKDKDQASKDDKDTEKHTLKLEFTNNQFDILCDAALSKGMRVHEYAVDKLNTISMEDVHSIIERETGAPYESKKEIELLNEDSEPYNPARKALEQTGGDDNTAHTAS